MNLMRIAIFGLFSAVCKCQMGRQALVTAAGSNGRCNTIQCFDSRTVPRRFPNRTASRFCIETGTYLERNSAHVAISRS